MDLQRFYVYIYLNPLKPGIWAYENHVFEFQPFYIGKGCGDRWEYHYKYVNTCFAKCISHKSRTIRKILVETGKRPPVAIIQQNMSSDDAYELESLLINHFGRKCDSSGILTNVSPGKEYAPILFGEKNGFYGKKHTEESKALMVAGYKKWYYSQSEEVKLKITERKRKQLLDFWATLNPEEKSELLKRRSNSPKNLARKAATAERNRIKAKEAAEKNEIKEQKRKVRLEKEASIFRFAKASEEEIAAFYKAHREGENNPNFGNGEKISGSKNPKAKIWKYTIKNHIFIVHGNKSKFEVAFKKFFKTNKPRLKTGFAEKYNMSVEILDNLDDILSTWIIFENESSFGPIAYEKFDWIKPR